MIDFTWLHDAGVRPRHIAALLKLNRGTVSGWINGRAQPHHFLVARVTRIMDALKAASDAGLLPPPKKLKGEEKTKYIKNVVVDNLKP